MALFSVDPEKCDKDGICISECPAKIIELNKTDPVPIPVEFAEERCIKCGHCVAVCPKGAFSHRDLSSDEFPLIERKWESDPRQTELFLRSRRSIRSYKNQSVERSKLEQLIRIACCAPSAANEQPWRWLVIEDSSELRPLIGLVIEWMRGVQQENPQEAEDRGLTRIITAWENGEERICRGAPHIIIAHSHEDWPWGLQDCTLAMEYIELFAPSLGLGTCWGGYFYSAINQYPPLYEALSLPSGNLVRGVMMVGYPIYKYQRLPKRNEPEVTWR